MKREYIKPIIEDIHIRPTHIVCGSQDLNIYHDLIPDDEEDEDMVQW